MKRLTRREYDTRFVQFTTPPRGLELSDRLEEEIHRNFPGNYGQYRVISRSLGGGLYAAAIITTQLTDTRGGIPLFLPLMSLPSLLKRMQKQKLTPSPSLPLVLWTGNEGEIIRFDQDGKPTSSRLCTELPEEKAVWCFFKPCRPLEALPAGGITLNSPFLPPAAGRINAKGHAAVRQPWSLLFILLLVFLLTMGGALLRYQGMQEKQLTAMKREMDHRQSVKREEISLLTEIETLQLRTPPLEPAGPYHILSTLTALAPEDLTIGKFIFEENRFTLEGSTADPILFSRHLSESGFLFGINISRVRQNYDGFSFLLRGRVHDERP